MRSQRHLRHERRKEETEESVVKSNSKVRMSKEEWRRERRETKSYIERVCQTGRVVRAANSLIYLFPLFIYLLIYWSACSFILLFNRRMRQVKITVERHVTCLSSVVCPHSYTRLLSSRCFHSLISHPCF